jgi:hypothetical protein
MSNSAASDVEQLAWFDLRIIRTMQSSAPPPHDS